ncbi:MAG: hypothetical protein PPP58_10055 [Natronomonas sp.]
MDDPDEEFARDIEELRTVLEDLQQELESPPEPPRGPLGVPRPPTPGEFLRFTEEYAIPAAIAGLEAAIRALELLAGLIRLADGRPPRSERRERVADLGQRSLDAVDDALADIGSAIEGGEPSNPEARRLLEQARELREEVNERLAAEADGSKAVSEADDRRTDGTETTTDEEATEIDVEAELDDIRRQIDDGDDE